MPAIDYGAVKTVSFEDVLTHYGIKLEKKVVTGDDKLVGSCPVHKHAATANPRGNQFQVTIKSPSHPKTENTFMCFGCNARGTVVDFVVLMSGLVRYDSVDWELVKTKRAAGEPYNWVDKDKLKLASQLLHSWFLEGKPITLPLHKKTAQPSEKPAPQQPKTLVNATWIEMWGSAAKYSKSFVSNEYLASRGIREDVVDEFGVGYYFNPKAPKSIMQGHIVFPIENSQGEHIGYAWRKPNDQDEPRYCFPPAERERDGVIYKFDRSLALWNFHRAIEEKDVIVVEGFFGVMNLYQHGYSRAVALMGSNLSDIQAELIAEHFQSATFLIDPDEAGRKLARQAMDALHGRILLKLIFPPMQADQMTAKELTQYLGNPIE